MAPVLRSVRMTEAPGEESPVAAPRSRSSSAASWNTRAAEGSGGPASRRRTISAAAIRGWVGISQASTAALPRNASHMQSLACLGP
ncbi:MAG: hypothetical protein EBQ99_05080 [Planctomycetes bacterium]|nr:hypothetical protein [Planctomycetota bacterium]